MNKGELMKLVRAYGIACREQGKSIHAPVEEWERVDQAALKAFEAVLEYVYDSKVPLEGS